MRYIVLLLVLLLSILPVSADRTIGIGGDIWSGNSTFDNTTNRMVSSNELIILDGRTKDDGNVDHLWDFDGGSGTNVINSISGSSNLTLASDAAWISSDTIFSNYDIALYGAKNDSSIVPIIPQNGTIELYIRPAVEINSSISVFQALASWNYVYIKINTDGKIEGSIYDDVAFRTVYSTNANWTADTIYKVSLTWGSSGNVKLYINETLKDTDSNYDGSISGVNQPIGIGKRRTTGTNQFQGTISNVAISNVEKLSISMYPTSGNRTTWHNESVGNETYELWFNFSSTQNHSDYYRENATGSYVSLGANQVGNKSYTVPTVYKNTDARATLHGNGTETPEVYSITFKTQASVGSVDITYYDLDYDNLTANVFINISNKTEPLTYINLTHVCNGSNDYCLNYPNGTAVQSCITCTGEGDTIWFNGSADRLPELDGYFINETEAAANTSTIIIPANSWGMVNNWTVATNFSNITANESNDVCYTYYNVSTGEWESHYPPYSWNSDYVIPLEASIMVFVNAETTVTATIVTPSSTELYTGWNMVFVEGTDNETIASIIADVGANCTDVWWFNSTAGAYSNTSSDTVQPCQGFLGYVTQDFTWTRSDL